MGLLKNGGLWRGHWQIGLWQLCSEVSGSFKMARKGTANIRDVNGEEWQQQTELWLLKIGPCERG